MKEKALDTFERGLKTNPNDPTLKEEIQQIQGADSTPK
jgi:hypothetical protein